MKKITTRPRTAQNILPDNSNIAAVVALDLGDRSSFLCRIELDGTISKSEKIATNRKSLLREFKDQPRLRIILEAGGQSNWIAILLANLGHEVLVVNPRRLKMISESLNKNDRNDTHSLGELGLTCPHLLRASEPRSEQTQLDRIVLVSREALVKSRTQCINCVRGQLKNFGIRVKAGTSETFTKHAREALQAPETAVLHAQLEGLLEIIDELNTQIRQADAKIAELCAKRYEATELMRQIRGVGPQTSLAFALALDNDPGRLRTSRDAGAYVGLKPKQRESGSRSPEMPITKLGDPLLRRYLVQCAQYVLSGRGEDSALQRWGKRLHERGGKNAKKRAVVAVARKLAVLLHLLWSRGEVYEPLHGIPVDKLAATA